MKLYVNCITSGAGLRRDIKELIPEMNLRRRMSRVVKSGVAAGIESLLEFGDRAAVEAVVTATGLGCIADSEKFLDSLIANEERMLNPTPFIQSTFNTVGAQIALLRGLHCYNTTYANRWTSFENALTDAALRIGAGLSRAVLVGAFDETTPSAGIILQRLGVAQQGGWGESSIFFVLTAEAFDTSVAAITGIRFPDGTAIGESAGTGRIQSRENADTGTSAGGNAGTGAAAGNVEEPGNATQSGECRTIRAVSYTHLDVYKRQGRICLHGHRRGDAQRRNGRGLPGGERGGNHLRQRQQCGAGDRGDRHHPRQAEHGDGRLGQYFPVDELDRDDEPLGDLQPAGHQPHALGGLRQRVARHRHGLPDDQAGVAGARGLRRRTGGKPLLGGHCLLYTSRCV